MGGRGAQGLFLGSVGESSGTRAGSSTTYYVTLTVRLVETDTGVTVWSTTQTEGGSGFWSTLLGTAQAPASEVTRAAVESCINTLVK